MKKVMKKLVLLMAAMALMLMPVTAQANDDFSIDQELDTDVDVYVENDITVDLDTDVEKDIDVDINVVGSEYLGYYYDYYYGHGLTVDGLASAVIDDKQILKWNHVDNIESTNQAEVTDNALEGAKGNIAVNVAAGDNNAQDNLAAITVSEQEKSMADAEIFKLQMSIQNGTLNKGNTNTATLAGDALMNAAGNIGVNVAAGNNNAQSNMLAIAYAPTKVGIASVSVYQEAADNWTMNRPVKVEEVQWVDVELGLAASGTAGSSYFVGGYYGGYSGSENGNYYGSENGYYYGYENGNYYGSENGILSGDVTGMSYQANNFYPDTWTHNPDQGSHDQHPYSPSQIGHFDMDDQTQGAMINPCRPVGSEQIVYEVVPDDEGGFKTVGNVITVEDPVGGLAFDNVNELEGKYSGSENGNYYGSENGNYYGSEDGYYYGSEEGSEEGSISGTNGAQSVKLTGSVFGSIPVVIVTNLNTTNTASLSGNALMNAVGNIGVNIAAGTGNLQANALAVTCISANGGGVTPNGGE